MKKYMYSVLDVKARVFSSPFVAINVAVATRDFGRACQDPDVQFSSAPGDYELYELGSWDDEACLLEPYEDRQFVIRGDDLVKFSKE